MTDLLLLEDDDSLGSTIRERLLGNGFLVRWVKTLQEARRLLEVQRFDLIILDVSLPDGSGFEIAEGLSTSSSKNAPIIFLTAMNGADFRLRAYELGAAEFIPKPFFFKELLLLINRLISQNVANLLKFTGGQLRIDSQVLELENSEVLPLARTEFQVLELLLRSRPKVVSREDLLREVFDRTSNPRSVDNCIVKLRQMLGPIVGAQIRTVRGIGYQWL